VKPALKTIRDRCRLVDGHWLWAGALSEGWPRVAAAEYTRHEGRKVSQHGRRAVWHVMHEKPIPNGWRVFGTCEERTCINPDHIECIPTAERGRRVRETGEQKGNLRRITAVRVAARKRSTLTPELIELITSSPKTGKALSEETGLGRTVISKVRKRKPHAYTPVGGMFTGLMGLGA
jgi:hypothetical protein